MSHIGIDFDNTIVLYDDLFYKYALKKKYISPETERTKIAVREYLISNNKESLYTKMQGIIYGNYILEAPVQVYLKSALINLRKLGHQISIVSHKTKYPIEGDKINLHEAAFKWLEENNFINKDILGNDYKNIFFEESLSDKINRIHQLKCDFYIDDLPKILYLINDNVIKILFNSNTNMKISRENKFINLDRWDKLVSIIESSKCK